jgi:hypothetical protein
MPLCVGDCFEVVDGILQLQVDPAGGLECGVSGLKANFPAAPGASPDACNGFEVRGNGLYAPCPDAVVGVHQWVGSEVNPLEVSSAGDGIFDWPSSLATIANGLCCDVGGRISSRAGGIRLQMNDGFRAVCDLQVNINGGGWATAVPATTIYCENSQGVDINIGLNNLLDENYLVVAAGASATYEARIHLDVSAGTADAFGIPAVEINWVMPQTGCC